MLHLVVDLVDHFMVRFQFKQMDCLGYTKKKGGLVSVTIDNSTRVDLVAPLK